MIDMGEHQNKDNQVRMIWEHHKQEALRNMISWKRKGWALYRTVGELLLSPKEGWRRMKRKFYVKVQHPEKRASSWEEGLSSLPEGEWAVVESQRGMTQDEVKIVCQGATPWKTGIFLRRRVELFTGGWVSCCWVPRGMTQGTRRMPARQTKKIEKESINIFRAT